MEKGNKKTIFAIAAVIIAAILMFILYQTFMPKGSKGDKIQDGRYPYV